MPIRIYTKTGDQGETGLFGGRRVAKDDTRVEAYGTADELNALLGVVLTQCSDESVSESLLSIQSELFQLGADLATPPEEKTTRGRVTIRRLGEAEVQRLEGLIDRWDADLPPLQSFILPGGHPVAAALHHARTVCRRLERRCVTLQQKEREDGTDEEYRFILPYLNRLSDLLFVLARAVNSRYGVEDVVWNPA